MDESVTVRQIQGSALAQKACHTGLPVLPVMPIIIFRPQSGNFQT